MKHVRLAVVFAANLAAIEDAVNARIAQLEAEHPHLDGLDIHLQDLPPTAKAQPCVALIIYSYRDGSMGRTKGSG